MTKRWFAMVHLMLALLVLSSGMLIAAPPAMAQGSTTTIVSLTSLEALQRSEGDDEIYIFQGSYSPFRGRQVRPDPETNCADRVDYWRFNDRIRQRQLYVQILATQGYDVAHVSLYDQDDGIFFLGGSDDLLGTMGIVVRDGRVIFFPSIGTWIDGLQPGEILTIPAGEARDVVVHYDMNDGHYRAVFSVVRMEPVQLPPNHVPFDDPSLGTNPVCE